MVALTEQLKYYGKGEGAWSALDGARAHRPPVERPDLHRAARRQGPESAPRRRRRARAVRRQVADGRRSKPAPATIRRTSCARRWRSRCRSSGATTSPRLVEFLDDDRDRAAGAGYFLELGAPVETELLPSLQEPDAAIRAAVAEVLGAIGGDASLTALQGLQDRRTRRPPTPPAAPSSVRRDQDAPARSDPAARLLRAADARRRARSDRQGAGSRDAPAG